MRNRHFMENKNYVLAAGVFLLVICIITLSLHVLDIYNIFYKNACEALEGHTETALAVLESRISRQREATAWCGENIMQGAESDIGAILKEATDDNELYEYFYVSPTEITYYANGNIRKNDNYEKLNQIYGFEYKNNFVSVIQEGVNKEGDTVPYLYGVYPVRVEDSGEKGYVISASEVENLFGEDSFNYLTEIGSCCIVNRTGDILLKDSGFAKEIGPEANFYVSMENRSNQGRGIKSALTKIKTAIPNEAGGSVTYKAASGEETYVSYHRIDGTREHFLVISFNDGILDDMIHAVMLRSFLVGLGVFILMGITLLTIWTKGENAGNIIRKLAYEDEVTGGKNLNYFKRAAAEIIRENKEVPFIMYRFDILNFRYINEAYGHKKADGVLTACIEEFKHFYSKNELCVRINSDHFVALVINDLSVNQRYQNYLKSVGEKAREIGVRYPIRLRVGMYQIHKGDRDIDIMIDHANVARKSMTGNEKSLESFYSDRIMADMKKVNEIESVMQSALSKGEFKVYLQPKWDIVNDCVVGAEALVRWIRDDGSMVYPSDFIPIFESNGFIEKLDFYMLETLCETMHRLEELDEYILYPISVNQSRILIINPDYVRNVEKLFKRYETAVEKLEIEITETVFFDEKEKMLDVINNLKALGVTLSMDDFGSGYSSLSILKDVPFDVLKIDRGFVTETANSNSSIIILQKIIDLAKSLGIDVICEGVETIEQVDNLRKLGCEKVQGYYFGKPMPIEDFLEKFCRRDEEY